MKALSLTQPWATLVVSGRKQIETRSWNTNYRGPLYIHAAKAFPPAARAFAVKLYGAGGEWRIRYLPKGALVATAYLLDTRPTEYVASRIKAEERSYGDYTPGRWAWILSNIEMLEPLGII